MTMIWLPRYRDVELASPSIGIAGRYRLVVRERDGHVSRDTGWFDNLITNYGLNRIGAGGLASSYGFIGTGTATPAFTDNALTGSITASGAPGGSSAKDTSSPYASTTVAAYRFPIGSLNGTYTEVAVGENFSGIDIKSRALILDSGGAPTTLAVTADQQLDMYYTYKKFPPLVDTSNTVTIDGVSTTVVGRAASVDDISSWNSSISFGSPATSFINIFGGSGALGSITGFPTGTVSASPNGTVTAATYSSGSFMRTISCVYDTGEANIAGGISRILLYWRNSNFGGADAAIQYSLSSPIAKDSTKTLVLNFGITWARA